MQLGRPAPPGRRALLDQRRPGGEVDERGTLAPAVRLQGGGSARRERDLGQQLERAPLGRPTPGRGPDARPGRRWGRAPPPTSTAPPGAASSRYAASGTSSTRRYSGLTKRRVVGRYGEGSTGSERRRRVQRVDQDEAGAELVPRSRPPGRPGRAGRRRPTSAPTAPSTAGRGTPTAARPPAAARAGSGVTTRRGARHRPARASASPAGGPRAARTWPRRRARRRRPAGRPTGPAATRSLRTPPCSSRTYGRAGDPCGTCTQTRRRLRRPDDGARRQHPAPARAAGARPARAAAAGGVPASTPRPARTAVTVETGTWTWPALPVPVLGRDTERGGQLADGRVQPRGGRGHRVRRRRSGRREGRPVTG